MDLALNSQQKLVPAMPVVIMCGGTGTRLREETEYKPKPMVEVGGKPILWHIMKIYAHYGLKDFILCLGYRGKQIKEYFLEHQLLSHDFQLDLKTSKTKLLGQDQPDDFRITFADTGESTLTGERLLKAAKYIDGDEFMMTYGDGVADIDLAALYAEHHAKLSDGRVGTISGIHPKSKYGLVNAEPGGRVTGFTEKPRLNDYTNGGFWILNKAFLNYCQPNQMVEEAAIDATAAGQLGMYNHNGFWHCMDTYKDKEDLEKMWLNNPKWKIWEKSEAKAIEPQLETI